jgi:hypothetical protein
MKPKRDENGKMSSEQKNSRFITVLQLVYLNAEKTANGYFVSDSDMQRVETELDFNTNEKVKHKVVEEQKKKFRKRKSYLFWSEILNNGNYSSYNDAKEILLMIHKGSEGRCQSMTQVKYTMETLFLALDDYFHTNKALITPSRFLVEPKKEKSKKCVPKKKSTKKATTRLSSNLSVLPF